MSTPTKQTVYLPVKVEDANGNYIPDKSVLIVKEQEEMDKFWETLVKQQQGYFFTHEELNELLSSVIKNTLETAAEKANLISLGAEQEVWNSVSTDIKDFVVNKQSITNTFEEVFQKFKL